MSDNKMRDNEGEQGIMITNIPPPPPRRLLFAKNG
jgi:hypothetical protein